MRGGLIGNDIGLQAARAGAFHHLRQDLGGVAQQADGDRLFRPLRLFNQRQRLVQRVGFVIDIAGAQTKIDARFLTLDGQHAGARQHARQRLRAAHAAQTGGQDPASGQIAVIVLTARFDEGFVGALHDALRADIDPRAGGHLAVHHQPGLIQLVKMIPVGPVRYQVGVRQQHARRVGVGAEDADGLARLNQQGFIGLQQLQRAQDLFKAFPVARRFANTAVNHQIFRPLGHVGIEVILDHAPGGFDQPVGAVQRSAVRRTHFARHGLGESFAHSRFLIHQKRRSAGWAAAP